MFKSKLLKGTMPKSIRFTLEYSDALSEVNKAIIQFYDDFNIIITDIIAKDPNKIPTINNLV